MPTQQEIYQRYIQQLCSTAEREHSQNPALNTYAADFSRWADYACPSSSLLNWSGSVSDWKAHARETLTRLLGRLPESGPVTAETLSVSEYDGVRIEQVRYQLPYGPATEGLFLTPVNATGPLPGFLMLHDHGAFKFYGKEKMVEQADDDVKRPGLREIRESLYQGQCWANVLAKQGYAVFVHDVFLWGSRRFQMPVSSGEDADLSTGVDKVTAYNEWAATQEPQVDKLLTAMGMTLAGIIAHEDRLALNYLLSRPEVDKERIGCGGLSGGGLRTAFLAGLDDRIVCAVCAGFMPIIRSMAPYAPFHTNMAFIHGMEALLDLPDTIALHLPQPLFVMQCHDDPLFSLAGMEAADELLRECYSRAGIPEHYRCTFYPGEHKLSRQMQDDTIAWLNGFLK